MQSVTSFEHALQRSLSRRTTNTPGWRLPTSGEQLNSVPPAGKSALSRTALGAAYRARKDSLSLERAEAQYRLVLQHVPGDLPTMTGLAAVLRDQGELSQARRLYEQVVAVAPLDAHALVGLAGVLPKRPPQRRGTI
ncbi:MAG TPA: hypothetical protein VKT82_10535 [Ktedonobacterales bacterium]|nr:hypothetical protein [Ktedonobacterales bacterium]